MPFDRFEDLLACAAIALVAPRVRLQPVLNLFDVRGTSGRRYWAGDTLPGTASFSQSFTVFRDGPVRLDISLNPSPSQNRVRRILPSISMVITSTPLLKP